jgi:hypothetical protein
MVPNWRSKEEKNEKRKKNNKTTESSRRRRKQQKKRKIEYRKLQNEEEVMTIVQCARVRVH